MSLLGPIATPLRSLTFALGGAALAWAWFGLHPAVPIVVVALAWGTTVAIQTYAESRITDEPMQALRLLEWRLLGIVIVSAGAAALVIIVTVWFTLDDRETKKLATSTQQLLAAVSAAPTAFIAAVSVSAESADGNIGDLIKTKFREKFVMTLTRTESRCRRDPGRRRST